VDVTAVNRPYKTVVLVVAGDDRISSILAMEERAALRYVVSTDASKEEECMLRLLLCVVKVSWVKPAELSAEKLFDTAVVIGHKVRDISAERDPVFGLACEKVDVDFALTTATLLFLAMAIIAPTSAAATSTTARQTAMKHRTVGRCHLSAVRRGRSAALSTSSRVRV
jgi:hypothetical protein